MNLREISIGRSRNCDIFLDTNCIYASSLHATMFYDGNRLMYRDRSSNGTMINNIRVHNRAVPIRRGDTIMIAGRYQLNWNQIDAYFPPNNQGGGYVNQGTIVDQPVSNAASCNTTVPNLSRWSWGAFMLSWIWGFFHGCWWIFLIEISTIILVFIPFIGALYPFVSLGLKILYGIKGTEWSWKNKQWSSSQAFEHSHDIWNKVGLGLFIFNIVVVPILIIVFFSAIVSVFL